MVIVSNVVSGPAANLNLRITIYFVTKAFVVESKRCLMTSRLCIDIHGVAESMLGDRGLTGSQRHL